MALVTWLAVFPAITLVLLALTPVISGWPLPLRTLLLTVILVPALTWVVMPRLTRMLRRWLYPEPKNDGSA
jgi:antibiotic biosynthesis monooxygenase (ABM) superfamily enzyme